MLEETEDWFSEKQIKHIQKSIQKAERLRRKEFRLQRLSLLERELCGFTRELEERSSLSLKERKLLEECSKRTADEIYRLVTGE